MKIAYQNKIFIKTLFKRQPKNSLKNRAQTQMTDETVMDDELLYIKFEEWDINASNKLRDPTDEELNISLSTIKTRYPHLNIESTITIMFKKIFERKMIQNRSQQIKNVQQHQGRILKIGKTKDYKYQIYDAFVYNQEKQDDQEVTQLEIDASNMRIDKLLEQQLLKESLFYKKPPFYLICNEKLKGEQQKGNESASKREFDINQEDMVKFNQRRKLVQIFCSHGYGLIHLQQFLEEFKDFDTNISFNNVIGAALTVAYRKMEDFIQLECRKDIDALNRQEMRNLLNKLVNCHQWMNEKQLETFIKFLKVSYNLKSSLPNREDTLKLYLVFLRIGRSADAKLPQKTLSNERYAKLLARKTRKKHQQWTKDMDIDICKLYMKYKRLNEVKDIIKLKYDVGDVEMSKDSIKSRFYRILRLGFRKISAQHKKYKEGTIPILKINDQIIKSTVGATEGVDARVAIVEFFLDQTNDTEVLVNTLNIMNGYIKQMESIKSAREKAPDIQKRVMKKQVIEQRKRRRAKTCFSLQSTEVKSSRKVNKNSKINYFNQNAIKNGSDIFPIEILKNGKGRFRRRKCDQKEKKKTRW